jgi:hypothetical protein
MQSSDESVPVWPFASFTAWLGPGQELVYQSTMPWPLLVVVSGAAYANTHDESGDSAVMIKAIRKDMKLLSTVKLFSVTVYSVWLLGPPSAQ